MITWQNLKSELSIPGIEEFAKVHSYRMIIPLIINSIEKAHVIISVKLYNEIMNVLSSSNNELGGLLLGKCFSVPYGCIHEYKYITFITDFVPAKGFKNSAVSLSMDSDIWSSAKQMNDDSKIIIGWCHSHPDLGAFFSNTDRATQKSFFCNDYSIGLVIDPVRNDYACFWGKDSRRIMTGLMFTSGEIPINT